MPESQTTWNDTIAEARKLVDAEPDGPLKRHRLGLLGAAQEVGDSEYGANLYERAIDGLEWPEDAGPTRVEDPRKLLAAYTAGEERGKAAASWLLDGNSSTADAKFLLQRILDAELDVPAPLSGEWADGLTIGDVLGELEVPIDHEDADDVLQSWEDGYSSGYYEEAERAARYLADIPVL